MYWLMSVDEKSPLLSVEMNLLFEFYLVLIVV